MRNAIIATDFHSAVFHSAVAKKKPPETGGLEYGFDAQGTTRTR
jgi:hypothetical protein